jgi:hypothetical protein
MRRALFPNAFLFFPVVERLTVDLMDRRFCDVQHPASDGHKEINIIELAVGAFHIDAGEVFVHPET